MKLDKDQFSANMNVVELDGKKVLVRPSHVESTKGKEVVIGKERPPRMINLKSPKGDQWQKNERSKLQQHLNATFDILMVKYKQSRASIRDHRNQTIRNTKLDNLISLSQASTSAPRSLSIKRSMSPL
jgi:hypothetical protein